MSYITGDSRDQITLFPEAIDDYITEENSVRFIDVYVDSLDFVELGFTYSEPKETGRPPYNPGDLLKLYLYGYLNRIRSSRQLEKATHCNIELIWLLRRLHPDFKTIADFRKDNASSLKKVCREFTLFCKRLELFGSELIAVDGSKFSAVNSNNKSFTRKKIDKVVKKIDNEIAAYLRELDKNDHHERDIKNPTVEELNKKIEILKSRKKKLLKTKGNLERSEEKQINVTDPDSRMMHSSKGKDVSYNVQIVTDSKNKLIADHEVTNDTTDYNQLAHMALKAKEILGSEKLKVTCDAGYYEDMNIKECHDNNIECYLPKPAKSNNANSGLYGKDDFNYDPSDDTYTCPAGQKLMYRRKLNKKGKVLKVYETNLCKSCDLKPKCTKAKRNRLIYRWEYEEIREEMEQRIRMNKELLNRRKGLVEHPFGTIKHWMGYGSFLTRGIDKVSTEMSLTVFAYNLKRAITILSVKKLVRAVV